MYKQYVMHTYENNIITSSPSPGRTLIPREDGEWTPDLDKISVLRDPLL